MRSTTSSRFWLADGDVQWQPRSLPLTEHAARWRAQHLRDLARARARRRRHAILLGASFVGILAMAAGVQAAVVLTGESDTRPIAVQQPGGEAERLAGDGGVPTELRAIARCESGGDPTAISSDGVYRGKYQFDRATWKEVGGRGDPAAAPEHVQDRLAIRLHRLRGEAPWPVCRA